MSKLDSLGFSSGERDKHLLENSQDYVVHVSVLYRVQQG